MEIVIGIPGKWQTRADIVKAIADKSNGFLFAGMVLMDTSTRKGYKLEVYDHDPNLSRAFAIAGRQSLTDADLRDIQSHVFTLYLIAEGGSVERAQEAMNVACGLLGAGGLAVKVETSGKAHSAEDWLALAAAGNETALYHAFVTLVGSKGVYYSCGMHNLGHRDAIVADLPDPNEAARLLQTFLLYILVESPTLLAGHTFSERPYSPYYRLSSVACETYPSDHSFFNSYGMWKLERVRGAR